MDLDLSTRGYQLTLVLIVASVAFTVYYAIGTAFVNALLWLFIATFLAVVAFTHERHLNTRSTNDR